ncbi:MAG: hypothetical protein VB051_06200 [Candidatus Pelethousia sp.]|nr:hypothetical protein [Candidatus Pelethousia sp.]
MKSAVEGAMYSLAHQKANELSAMKAISQEMVSRLAKEDEGDEGGGLDGLPALLQARRERMAAIDQLDKRFAFLQDSGYEPQEEEAARIALEQGTIRALLKAIQALDAQAGEALNAQKDRLAESMKEVRDWQKGLQAYAGPPEEEEGRQVDTLR